MRVQLVRRGDKWYFRAEPETAKNPTLHQIEARILFGEIAKKAKGMKFTGELPPAAELVRKEMKDREIGRTRKLKKWETILLEGARKEGNKRAYEKILKGELVA